MQKGDPQGFFDIHCVAKYRNKLRGDPLVEFKNVQKKSHSSEKNPSEKHQGESYVFEVLDVDVFVLASMFWTSVVQELSSS